MVQAYLGKPDYTNAMNAGLRTRLAYDEARRARRRSSGGGGGGMSERPGQKAPAGSPEARAEYRNQMLNEAALEQEVAQAEAGVAQTEATTADTEVITAGRIQTANLMKEKAPGEAKKAKLANKMNESKLQDEQIARQKTILNNLLQYVPQVTQETYRDLLDYGRESGLDLSAFTPAEKIEGMSPVEWKVQHSKLEKMMDPSGGKLKAMADAKIKEDKETLKAKNAARKEYVRIVGVIDRINAGSNVDPTILAKLPPVAQALLGSGNHEKAVGILTEYMRQLKEEHGLNFDPKPAVGGVTHTFVPGKGLVAVPQ